MEKILLVTIKLNYDKSGWTLEDMSREMEELIGATGARIAGTITCNLAEPTPNYFIGSGKVDEIAAAVVADGIEAVVFSHDLSGTQQRNLERVIGCKTIDRTQLILDIFARRAKSPEGKMQVELAQLQYLMPRLVGKGLVLSQQGGGIGTSGPGETKLETDRRRIRDKIEKLKEDLRGVKAHRALARKKRAGNAVSSVALVGYTNAGKSTLLNALTEAGQTVVDGLFTTLDPLSKSLKLPNGEQVVVSDTVGFLHDLPHGLIEAFKATLEEVVESDLLIHVLDVSHRNIHEHYRAVCKVLEDLGCHEKPTVVALNKIDLVEDEAYLNFVKDSFPNAVPISATGRNNLDQLIGYIQECFQEKVGTFLIKVPHSRMDLVSRFYKMGKVIDIEYQQSAIKVKFSMPKVAAKKLLADKDIEIEDI
jgi:GTP-binding protein HflX